MVLDWAASNNLQTPNDRKSLNLERGGAHTWIDLVLTSLSWVTELVRDRVGGSIVSFGVAVLYPGSELVDEIGSGVFGSGRSGKFCVFFLNSSSNSLFKYFRGLYIYQNYFNKRSNIILSTYKGTP